MIMASVVPPLTQLRDRVGEAATAAQRPTPGTRTTVPSIWPSVCCHDFHSDRRTDRTGPVFGEPKCTLL